MTDESSADSTAGGPERSVWMNALVGAVVTVVTVFIPLSPALGGGVAGYLQGGTDGDGLRVGALAGLIAAVPLLTVIGLVVVLMGLGAAVSGVLVPAFLIAGVVLLVVATFVVAYTVVLGAVGGLVGAAVARSDAGSTRSDRDDGE